MNRLAPGRIICGLGTGFTARNTMGLPPIKLGELREYIRIIRGLLGGETVEVDFPEGRRKIRFLNPESLINIEDLVPIHLSAFAPKARKLTAEVADGWMTFVFDIDRALGEVKQIDDVCREVGRKQSLYKTAFTLGCVLGDKEPVDSARAKAHPPKKLPRRSASSTAASSLSDSLAGSRPISGRICYCATPCVSFAF